MNLPNLLNRALRLIPKQTVQWTQFQGVTTGANLLEVATFATPVPVVGSFQPVPRSMFEQLGLELNKDYAQFYTSTAFADLTRDTAGDQFAFGGDTYQVMSNTEWNSVNGWGSSMAVKITP